MNEGTDMEKEICIAEVIAPNVGYQRFRSCAPWSDRNNKNPSSDLLVLLKAQKYALTRNLKTQVLNLNAYRYPMVRLQKLHELFGCINYVVSKGARVHVSWPRPRYVSPCPCESF